MRPNTNQTVINIINPRPNNPFNPRKRVIILFCALILILLALSSCSETLRTGTPKPACDYGPEDSKTYIKVINNIPVRIGPSTEFPTIEMIQGSSAFPDYQGVTPELRSGSCIQIIGRDRLGEWFSFLIPSGGGIMGWVRFSNQDAIFTGATNTTLLPERPSPTFTPSTTPITFTPTITNTFTPTPTPSDTPLPSPTDTPSNTPTPTATATFTATATATPQHIPLGQVIQQEVVAGQRLEYRISLEADDWLYVGLTTSGIQPHLTLHRADMATIPFGNPDQEPFYQVAHFDVAVELILSIDVRAAGSLELQVSMLTRTLRSRTEAGNLPLSLSSSLTINENQANQADDVRAERWYFLGTEGSAVTIRLRPVNNNYGMGLRIYQPDGSIWRNLTSPSGIEERQQILPLTGVYTVIVYRYYGEQAGDYELEILLN